MIVTVIAALHALFLGVFAANLLYLRRARRERATPEHWPRVSVLIPARNEEANLQRLLPTLQRQDYPDFEVLVYDDGSDDATGVVIEESGGPVRGLRGDGPPPGWVGKVHALYQTTRDADGEVYLFLDADAALRDERALRRLVEQFLAVNRKAGDAGGVMTGLPRLRGGGSLLTSLVPFAMMTALPLALVPRTASRSLASLNGQCWLIRAEMYHRHEPHAAHADEVLEDVKIGRFLKGRGMRLALRDLQDDLDVWMYRSLSEAWAGFRKNAYLLQGGTPLRFVVAQAIFWGVFVLPPLVSPWFLVTLYTLKAGSDTFGRFPLRVRLLAPLSLLLGGLLPLDSAVSHWTGRVQWKGRSVGPQAQQSPEKADRPA
jgi:glycosyltransferase involved in cell wall biosynthesis